MRRTPQEYGEKVAFGDFFRCEAPVKNLMPVGLKKLPPTGIKFLASNYLLTKSKK